MTILPELGDERLITMKVMIFRIVCEQIRLWRWLLANLLYAFVLASSPVTASIARAANNIGGPGKSMNPSPDQPAARPDQASKARIFHEVMNRLAAGQKLDPVLLRDFVTAQNDGLRSGPNIGAKVPDFVLPDQNAREHSLDSLMGADGLLLVFVRSADW
jgi:hypothetical protein